MKPPLTTDASIGKLRRLFIYQYQCDAKLFAVTPAGVGVVGIHDDRRIAAVAFPVHRAVRTGSSE